MAGYQIERDIVPVSPSVPGKWSRGDVYRVDLPIVSTTPTIWAVVTDPIPAGATLTGGGLGSDSPLPPRPDPVTSCASPLLVDRKFHIFRAYSAFLPQGTTH